MTRFSWRGEAQTSSSIHSGTSREGARERERTEPESKNVTLSVTCVSTFTGKAVAPPEGFYETRAGI